MENVIEDLPGEEWVVYRLNPRYMASNLGRVKSLPYVRKYKGRPDENMPEKLINLNPQGLINLRDDTGYTKSVSRARVIAQSFIPNPVGGVTIGYEDGDETNHRADNLYWLSSRKLPANLRRAVAHMYFVIGAEIPDIARAFHTSASNVNYMLDNYAYNSEASKKAYEAWLAEKEGK